ncbi:hypothetical protein [Paraburkholderia sp.]|jgi:3,4-dihydroxy-2-butanone 4-phosphate synthase|uniref:hypothetical protein n=1 Tax=Paraburkholderia sp. TaxID=1926495 RepID=UPI002F4121A0
MKGFWFSLGAAALIAVGAASVAPSIAQAAGLTRAAVIAEIADDRSGGFDNGTAEHSRQAVDTASKLAALRAARAAGNGEAAQ